LSNKSKLLEMLRHIWASAKESRRLFTKNTALCEHESGCIGGDACPVPEG
jgi:hypothetical protein